MRLPSMISKTWFWDRDTGTLPVQGERASCPYRENRHPVRVGRTDPLPVIGGFKGVLPFSSFNSYKQSEPI